MDSRLPNFTETTSPSIRRRAKTLGGVPLPGLAQTPPASAPGRIETVLTDGAETVRSAAQTAAHRIESFSNLLLTRTTSADAPTSPATPRTQRRTELQGLLEQLANAQKKTASAAQSARESNFSDFEEAVDKVGLEKFKQLASEFIRKAKLPNIFDLEQVQDAATLYLVLKMLDDWFKLKPENITSNPESQVNLQHLDDRLNAYLDEPRSPQEMANWRTMKELYNQKINQTVIDLIKALGESITPKEMSHIVDVANTLKLGVGIIGLRDIDPTLTEKIIRLTLMRVQNTNVLRQKEGIEDLAELLAQGVLNDPQYNKYASQIIVACPVYLNIYHTAITQHAKLEQVATELKLAKAREDNDAIARLQAESERLDNDDTVRAHSAIVASFRNILAFLYTNDTCKQQIDTLVAELVEDNAFQTIHTLLSNMSGLSENAQATLKVAQTKIESLKTEAAKAKADAQT